VIFHQLVNFWIFSFIPNSSLKNNYVF